MLFQIYLIKIKMVYFLKSKVKILKKPLISFVLTVGRTGAETDKVRTAGAFLRVAAETSTK